MLVANVVWHRTGATIDDVLALRIPGIPYYTRARVERQTPRLPQEILEMIISNLTHNIPSLKACAATCFTWYNAAAPYLHHTLILREWHAVTTRRDLIPLAALHQLGLLPLVKKVEFRRGIFKCPWVVPDIFGSQSLDCFSALVNLQDLTIADLFFSEFASGIEKYFGHFSPTLRSIALVRPVGSPRQLLDFLGLFPKLDDIKVAHYLAMIGTHDTPDTPRAPVWGSLRGKLTLEGFVDQRLLEEIITSFGEMRFSSMDLDEVVGVQLLLDACAETLQTLRYRLDRRFTLRKRFTKRVARHMS